MKKIVDVVVVSFLLILLLGFTLLLPFSLFLLAFAGLLLLPYIDVTIVNPLDFVGNGVILGVSSLVYFFCLDICYMISMQPYKPKSKLLNYLIENIVSFFAVQAFAFIYCYFAPSIMASDIGTILVGCYFFICFSAANLIFDLFIEKHIRL